MKMAKKLLAVVLTGVMAMSVLTGCAIGDAVAESAMKSELNRLGKTNAIETTYEKDTKANDTAKYDLKAALNKTVDTVKALDDKAATTVEAVEAVTTTTDGAVAYVYEVPSSAKQSKKWTTVAKDLNEKLYANAYKSLNTKGDKATITVNYDTVTVKVVKDASKNTTEKKDFIVVVAKAAV